MQPTRTSIPVTDTQPGSVDELVKILTERYKEEIVIRSNVRVKASFLIAAQLTVVSVVAKTFIDLSRQGGVNGWLMASVIAMLLLFVLAIVLFVVIYQGTPYETFPSDYETIHDNWAKKEPAIVKELVLRELIFLVNEYTRKNTAKEKQFNAGLITSSVAIVLLIVTVFFQAISQ